MPTYIGQQCTSCRNTLTKTDDIVVCPECGSPYHRECYKMEGKCINTLLHENNESWQPEVIETAAAEEPRTEADAQKVLCKSCGAENDADSAFCKNCGSPVNLEKAAGSYYNRENGANQTNQQQGYGGFGNVAGMFGFIPITKDQDVDGNTAGEYADYVGESSKMYYLPKFMRFAKGSKTSFNFSAFFFTHFYFFFRKMIVPGIIILIAQTLLSLPSSLFLMADYGFMDYLPVMSQKWFVLMTNVFSIISYVMSIFIGLFANYLYYKKAKSDIKGIKEKVLEEDARRASIVSSGGSSWKYVLAGALGSMVISYASLAIFLKLFGLQI